MSGGAKKKSVWILVITGIILSVGFYHSLPAPLFKSPTSFVILDKDQQLLSASIAPDGQWRFPATAATPSKFAACITTFEDKRFYQHPGIDLFATGRAIIANLKAGKVAQGGSTLTMQVIRLTRKNSSRNLLEKCVEAFESLRLECTYTKEEILALYAANAPFGGNVVGLNAAAWRYYGRAAEQLSWGEMAALSVLPNAPSLVYPGKNHEALLKKRNDLLDRLVTRNIISLETATVSKLEPLPGAPHPLPQIAPHLLQRFKEGFQPGHYNTTIGRTTVDRQLQIGVNAVLQQHHSFLQASKINNACALVLDVETGNVLAYAGNIYDQANLAIEGYVDVIKSPRSPGSALKPLLYASMFASGSLLPQALVPDVPTVIGGYAPKNFDMDYDGAVPASLALARSLNVPAVKLLQQFKYPRFYDELKQVGITTLNQPADHYGLSLILGGAEVTMWDLVGVYASMARVVNHQKQNLGLAREADFFAPRFTNSKKEIKKSTGIISTLDATSIYFTFEAMNEVMRPGEESLWQQFYSSQKIAWKTGTSFGFRDAWAIGITPRYVVAAWAGNTNGEGRAGLIGVQAAAPIMFDIFRMLPQGKWFEKPTQNFSFVPVCRQSGFRASANCPERDTIMVSKNGYRSPLCPFHKVLHLDATGTFQVDESCASPSSMQHKSWFILPPTMEFYYKEKHPEFVPAPPFLSTCTASDGTRQMDLVYPEENAAIYIPLELDGELGKAIFTAAHRVPGERIYWHMDNEFIATTINFHQLAVSPSTGKHVLTIVDEHGESISRHIEIFQKK